ncbi:MAG: hypothetical protein PHO15_00425 [Eubacteriales bacterium]|nr:hypothetical protein [Eubacteriales bacterium]
MNIEIPDFFNLLTKLNDRQLEERAWEYWIAMVPHMGENYIPFSEYFDSIKQGDNGEVYADQVFI